MIRVSAMVVVAFVVSTGLVYAGAGCSTHGSSEKAAAQPAPEQKPATTPAAPAKQLVPQKTCPVMGGEIDKQVYADHEGKRVYFCCPACVATFKKEPAKYLKKLEELGEMPESVK